MNRVLPRAFGQLGQRALQLARRWRRGQQRPDHGKAKLRPALPGGEFGVLIGLSCFAHLCGEQCPEILRGIAAPTQRQVLRGALNPQSVGAIQDERGG